MQTYTDKMPVNTRPSISAKQNYAGSTCQFSDNRPEAIAQRKLHEAAKSSSQGQKAAQLQAMADNSSSQSTLQKKVAVAQSDKEEENDWVILTNLEYAKNLVGGGVVDFGADSDFSDMSNGENLAVVGHGSAGSIQGYNAESIATALTKQGKEMPINTKLVILLSCNAAAPTESQNPKSSLVSKLASLLGESGYKTIVEGKPSLTQVSPGTGINATKPAEKERHLKIESELINKYDLNFTTAPESLRPERIEWFKGIEGVDLDQLTDPSYLGMLRQWLAENNIRKFASEILSEQGIDPSALSLEEKSVLIAKITGPFYQELMQTTQEAGTLFEPGTSTGSGTLLATGGSTLEL